MYEYAGLMQYTSCVAYILLYSDKLICFVSYLSTRPYMKTNFLRFQYVKLLKTSCEILILF